MSDSAVVSDWIRRTLARCSALTSDLQNPFRDLAESFAQALIEVRTLTIPDLASSLSQWLLSEIRDANNRSHEEITERLTDALEEFGVDLTAAPWIHKSLEDACFVFRLGERNVYVSLPRKPAP